MTETRKELSFYEGKRLEIEGYYYTTNVNGSNGNKYSLIQDMKITTPEGKFLHCDHCHVQRADEIMLARPLRGTKISFTAFVHRYSKNDEDAWGFTFPEDVSVCETEPTLPMPTFPIYQPPVPVPIVVDKKPSVAATMRAVKALTGKVQPDVLSAVVPHLGEIADAVALCGGEGEFLELVGMLS